MVRLQSLFFLVKGMKLSELFLAKIGGGAYPQGWRLAYNSEGSEMDADKTITEIELLERILALPDTRPFSISDREAANRRHDELSARNPWFRLWQQFGLPR